MTITTLTAQSAVAHLRRRDRALRSVIDCVGPFQLRLEKNRFGMLVRSILSQQLSVSAARTIRQRLEALMPAKKFSPDSIWRLNLRQMRGAGVSGQKAEFLFDLADAVISGRVRLAQIGRKSDDEIVAELTQVRGVGRWTAQMFLIFSLGRLDVLPTDDLGVRAAIRNLYGLAELPDKSVCERIATTWRPYASVASWYCWRSIDLKSKVPA